MDPLQEYTSVKIFRENQGARALSNDPVHRQRGKHRHKILFIRDAMHYCTIKIIYCSTVDNVKDIMKKTLTRN